MTTKRYTQLENLLRRLRQRAFDCERCANLIPTVKARLMPMWKAIHQQQEHEHSERMLRLWQ